MKEQQMFPYCDVYYKTDNTPGWKMALFPGSEEEVMQECKKYSEWVDYKVQYSGSSVAKPQLNLNYHRSADSLYMCTDTIYSPELDRYFLNRDDEIPYPQTNARSINNIVFNYCFDKDDEDYWCNNDPTNFEDDREDIYVTGYMGIVISQNELGIILEINEYLYKEFEQFIEKIKQDKYAVLNINEFYEYKFLAWVKDNEVRFMVQDYNPLENNKYVDTILDVIIDKELFINKLEEMYNNFKQDSLSFRKEFETEIYKLRQNKNRN